MSANGLRKLACAIFSLGIFGVTLSFAETPKKASDSPAAEGKSDGQRDEAAPETDRGRRAETRERGGRGAGRLIPQLTKLQEEMSDKLTLSSEQKKSINTLFEEYTASLREPAPKREAAAADGGLQTEIKALRDQMTEAREQGDQKKVDELRGQVREKMRQRAAADADGTKQFLDSVRAQLNEKQVERFNELVSRLRLDGAPRNSVGDLGRLRRALNDPAVGLSAEQKSKVDGLMREGFTSREPGKWNEANIEETVNKIRENVMKELSAEQKAKVEELMAAAEKDPPAHRMRERMARPGSHPGSPSTPPGSDENGDEEGKDDE